MLNMVRFRTLITVEIMESPFCGFLTKIRNTDCGLSRCPVWFRKGISPVRDPAQVKI